jgi:eukaryotic-like serine/threonine-protein kinase
MILHAGAVIAGRYRLLRKIGSGGMGEVWAAEHTAIGVQVALKALLPAAAMDQQVVARFRREAYLLGRLRSDRVARVVDFVEDRRFGLVLVMDFVEGEPLSNVLEMRRLNVEESIALGIDIVTALCDLHRAKVVHRDLKPDNIILEPLANGKTRAVIVDFGVSRLESTGEAGEEESITGITQADVAVGTIPYMAPEQFLSSRDVTGAADLYAVGAILFRALSGQHVYGDTEDLDYAKTKLTTRAPELRITRFDRVGRGFSAIVARALERVPDDRFESADAMLAELLSLSDLARATALDLDAATEQALPPSSLVSDDVTEATRRMSRPPGLSDSILEESTLESPALPDDPTTESSPPPAVDTPLASTPPPSAVRYTVPSPGIELRESAPREEPPREIPRDVLTADTAPSATITPTPRPARTFTTRALAIAILAALLAGALVGFELRALLVR